MASVCCYFQIHQPFRLRRFSIFDQSDQYFDDDQNRAICQKVASKCYRPATKIIADLIRQHDGRFRVAFSLTGQIIEQWQAWAPDVLELFQDLAATGAVEFLAETYHHSLSFLYSPEEFTEQVRLHEQIIGDLFDQQPTVFRNTELMYSNAVAAAARALGYHIVLCEGADKLLGYRSPAYLYTAADLPDVKLLLKNYRLSDDIAFRFSNREWRHWPLTAEKFAQWIDQVNGSGHTVNLFMDYETFGEHQWADTGIFDFLRHLPEHVLATDRNDFRTPSEVAAACDPAGAYDCPHVISWADVERDLSAWLGNAMQSNAMQELYRLEAAVRQSGDEAILRDWRRLQTSDHFYYMSTKTMADGQVHSYFSPFDSPYDSFINFMNVLDHLRRRLPQSAAASAGA